MQKQELVDGVPKEQVKHPYGYFCHYVMAQNSDGNLGKHWVTYFDKIETRTSKGLELC